jgi:hypothetical protein
MYDEEGFKGGGLGVVILNLKVSSMYIDMTT